MSKHSDDAFSSNNKHLRMGVRLLRTGHFDCTDNSVNHGFGTVIESNVSNDAKPGYSFIILCTAQGSLIESAAPEEIC